MTEPGSGIRQDQWIEVLLFLRDKYPNVIGIKRDAGSAAEDIILSGLQASHRGGHQGHSGRRQGARGAHGGPLAGQIMSVARHRRVATRRRFQATVRWDLPLARERGKWVLLSTIPNDVTDAADYGLEPYYNAKLPRRRPQKSMEAMRARLFREAMRPVAPTFGYEEDPGLVQLLGEHGPPS